MKANKLTAMGSLRFLGMEVRCFECKERLWIPVVDLAVGLRYANPRTLRNIIRYNPDLFKAQGNVLRIQGRAPRMLSLKWSGRTPEMLLSMEGMVAVLMLNRGKMRAEIRAWVAKNLGLSMVQPV